jgi:hypothetical protein
MIISRNTVRFLPWVLLATVLLVLFLVNHWPFGRKKEDVLLINSHTILEKVERLGRLELVRYHYREILDYNRLSQAKISGSAALRIDDYEPDLKAVMIAAGEAVGCIDLGLVQEQDIQLQGDSVLVVRLPAPQLCYHRLDMSQTRVLRFERGSWWSKLFTGSEEESEVLQRAYRHAEAEIRDSALKQGILEETRNSVHSMLQPMLESMTGRRVILQFRPDQDLPPLR